MRQATVTFDAHQFFLNVYGMIRGMNFSRRRFLFERLGLMTLEAVHVWYFRHQNGSAYFTADKGIEIAAPGQVCLDLSQGAGF